MRAQRGLEQVDQLRGGKRVELDPTASQKLDLGLGGAGCTQAIVTDALEVRVVDRLGFEPGDLVQPEPDVDHSGTGSLPVAPGAALEVVADHQSCAIEVV